MVIVVAAVQPVRSESCKKISAGGIDFGRDGAQKFADELLAGDIETFKKKNGVRRVRIARRFRLCKEYLNLGPFGIEYNCTSGAIVCW